MSPPPDFTSSAEPLDLMQFWDAPAAPDQVEELMKTWSSDPQFDYHRYSWDSAHSFVSQHFDRRTLMVFESCAVPAMQCDVFRLCWLLEVGGIYIDADQGNRGRNEGFTDTSVRGHLYFGKEGEGRFCNGLMSFFEPQDPLVGAALERACANVERRAAEDIWHVTGPGVITKLFADVGPEDPLFEGVQLHGLLELAHAMEFGSCDYKRLPTHWANVTTIYRSPISGR